MTDKLKRPFTGWHMTAILVAFFGTVVAVNVTMAMFATGTFGGLVVENSYVASQHFNRWLAEAHAQDALGWNEEIGLDGERRITIALNGRHGPLSGAAITAVASHPLGRTPDFDVRFTEVGTGSYRAMTPLPAGRWIVHFVIVENGHEKRLIKDLT